MRFIAVIIGLLLLAAPAHAAVAQLSFENGSSILRNPDDGQFVLRSANLDQVRLTLYRLISEELLNQVSAARSTQSITEDGLRGRVIDEATVVWRSNFVLDNNNQSAPQGVPLSVVAGNLSPGVYMLAASAPDATVSVPTVVQWFHIGELAVHVAALDAGNLVMTTHRAAAVAVGYARLQLLDNKGAVVSETPSDWRTDANGAVFWQGPWPAGAVLLRADDSNGNTALLPLTTAGKPGALKARGRGIAITPLFEGNSVPAGATAGFNIALRSDDGALVEETMRYEFARVTHSYKWTRDKENIWQYQTTATPTVIERGTLRPARGQGAGAPVKLMLAVTEGRFRLTVTTPDGAMRQAVEFTAGWWRQLPVDQDEMQLEAKFDGPNRVVVSAPDRAETDAPRWVVVTRKDSVQTRTSNRPDIELPADRRVDQPLLVGLCVPGRDSAPVVCAGKTLMPEVPPVKPTKAKN